MGSESVGELPIINSYPFRCPNLTGDKEAIVVVRANALTVLCAGKSSSACPHKKDTQCFVEEDVDSEEGAMAAEKVKLINALEDAGGSKAKAARILEINRTTLYYRLRKYGLAERYGLSSSSSSS